jgi:hypothetical protein
MGMFLKFSVTSIYCLGQRMSGTIPPLPNTPSWHGAQLKHRDNFIFTFTYNFYARLTGQNYKYPNRYEQCLIMRRQDKSTQ